MQTIEMVINKNILFWLFLFIYLFIIYPFWYFSGYQEHVHMLLG